MKKTTKGAAAAGVAAVLLLGGAGSLAYWSDSQTISGGAINAGTLSLGTPNCGAGWTLDTGEDVSGAAFVPGTTLLVPGDVITETCTAALTATGEHMRGSVTASAPASISPFVLDVSALTDGATDLTTTGFTEANSGDNLSVTLTVTFPSTSDNTTKLSTATLDDITLTATQIHS